MAYIAFRGQACALAPFYSELKTMGAFGPIHWIIVAVVLLLLFGGRGKLSGIMGDAAKGIRAFKDGLKDEDANRPATPLPRVERERDEVS
jgi:sec-independent protein translocase protein TatA